MAVKSYLVQGLSSYAKILGTPPPGYDNGPPEWSFDLILNEEGVKSYLASGADKFYIKTHKETGEQYIRFKRNAQRKDGSEGQPILVFGPDGKEWPQKDLIGNGSVLNVKFAINEVKSKGTKRLKPGVLAVQVWEHVKYKSSSGFPTKEAPAQEEEWDTDAA